MFMMFLFCQEIVNIGIFAKTGRNGSETKTGWNRDPILVQVFKANPIPVPVGRTIPVGHYFGRYF